MQKPAIAIGTISKKAATTIMMTTTTIAMATRRIMVEQITETTMATSQKRKIQEKPIQILAASPVTNTTGEIALKISTPRSTQEATIPRRKAVKIIQSLNSRAILLL